SSTLSTTLRPRYDLLSSTAWSFSIPRQENRPRGSLLLDPVLRQRARTIFRVDDDRSIRYIEGQLTACSCAFGGVENGGSSAGHDEFAVGSGVFAAVCRCTSRPLFHGDSAGSNCSANLLRSWCACIGSGTS